MFIILEMYFKNLILFDKLYKWIENIKLYCVLAL